MDFALKMALNKAFARHTIYSVEKMAKTIFCIFLLWIFNRHDDIMKAVRK